MRRETQAFLDLVRDAEDPTRGDEARVQRALEAAVAAGSTSSVVGHGWLENTSLGKALAKLGAFAPKLGVIAACVAGSALGTGDTARVSESAISRGTDPSLRRPALSAPQAPDNVDLELGEATSAALPWELPARAEPVELLGSPEPTPRATQSRPTGARAGTLRPELDLLHKVRAALKRGDGDAALRALDSHRTTDRQLYAERQVARILALCLVGRVLDARRAAAAFDQQHPQSVHREAIASSCANPQRIRRP